MSYTYDMLCRYSVLGSLLLLDSVDVIHNVSLFLQVEYVCLPWKRIYIYIFTYIGSYSEFIK